MRKAQEEDQSLHNIRRKCEHREVDNTLNTCTNCAYICSDPLPTYTLPTMSVANYIVIPAHGSFMLFMLLVANRLGTLFFI